jgi:hypothetical protein
MVSLAIPNPMDWVDGTVYLDTDYNREIRDAISFLLKPPMFYGVNTVATTLTNNTWTPIPINSEIINTEGAAMHSTVTNNTRVAITHEGWWDILAQTSWDSATLSDTNRRITNVRKNGTFWLRGRQDTTGSLSATQQWVRSPVKVSVYLFVGDYIELVQYQDSGSATMKTWISAGETQPYLTLRWRSK